MSKPLFFTTPADLNAWLRAHHETGSELLVGFYKKHTGKPSITWPESVDEALCFGWIDGIRRRIDDESYSIRFTPRRPTSIWSARNIERVRLLTAEGRMRPPGIRAFEARGDRTSDRHAYEQKSVKLSKSQEDRLRSNRRAWTYFQSLPPSVQKPSVWWILSAKKEETRARRLQQLIECSAREERLPQFIKPVKARKHK